MEKEILEEWLSVADQLKKLKKKEMELRIDIATEVMGHRDLCGTKTSLLPDGDVEVTVTVSERLTVDSDLLMKLPLTDLEKQCIQWKPSIIKAAFNKLPKDAVLRTAVTIKPAAPTIRVVGSWQ